MLIDSRMANFYGDFTPMIFCLINLTDRSTGHGFRIKLFENFFDFFTIIFFEIFPSFFIRMFRSILSQVYKLLCHLRTNNISSMTEVLEGLDPYNSCSLYCRDEQVIPKVLSSFEKDEWQSEDGRNKDDP